MVERETSRQLGMSQTDDGNGENEMNSSRIKLLRLNGTFQPFINLSLLFEH